MRTPAGFIGPWGARHPWSSRAAARATSATRHRAPGRSRSGGLGLGFERLGNAVPALHGQHPSRIFLGQTADLVEGLQFLIRQLHLDGAQVVLELIDEELKALDEVSRLPQEYPGWMLAMQGGNRVPKPFEPKAEAAAA